VCLYELVLSRANLALLKDLAVHACRRQCIFRDLLVFQSAGRQ